MRISDWSSDVCSSDLNRPPGLLLDDCRSISDAATHHNIAAPQLAVDCQGKQRMITHAVVLIEVEPNCPDISRPERALCACQTASVPRTKSTRAGLEIRNSHDTSPFAEMAMGRSSQPPQSLCGVQGVCPPCQDRKSTLLNSSH